MFDTSLFGHVTIEFDGPITELQGVLFNLQFKLLPCGLKKLFRQPRDVFFPKEEAGSVGCFQKPRCCWAFWKFFFSTCSSRLEAGWELGRVQLQNISIVDYFHQDFRITCNYLASAAYFPR